MSPADWDAPPMRRRHPALSPLERIVPPAPTAALSPIEAIVLLENGGYITPKCHVCGHVYKDAVAVAQRLSADPAWRPASHTPSLFSLDKGRAHCDCAKCDDKRRAGAL